jgi:hypothetical protein
MSDDQACGILDSMEGQAVLARHGLPSHDLERARIGYQRTEGLPIGTLIGLNERGLLGATRRGYDPNPHATFDQLLIHIPLGTDPGAARAQAGCQRRWELTARRPISATTYTAWPYAQR